jgi:hypothetical protein
MSLSLSESQAINEIARFFYDFLPGNPHPYANQGISFQGIAREMNLLMFWQEGSKLPAITTLLENTLDHHRDLFCDLILEIVRRGLKYRNNKGNPITREEILELNELITKVEFKIPELWNNDFLNSLPSDKIENEQQQFDQNKLDTLKKSLIDFVSINEQKRGFKFEKFLKEFFDTFGLKPKSSFRLVGEQIDGSLQLKGYTYLIEAKWQNKPVGNADLLIFRGKVEGKASWSRGLFISYNGFSKDGLEAFSKVGATNIICMDGQDLYFILEGKISLNEAIELKARRAAETGEAFINIYSLI